MALTPPSLGRLGLDNGCLQRPLGQRGSDLSYAKLHVNAAGGSDTPALALVEIGRIAGIGHFDGLAVGPACASTLRLVGCRLPCD